MSPNPQFPADLVTFTEEIVNWKLHFLCSVNISYPEVCSTSGFVYSPYHSLIRDLLGVSFCHFI